jgi:SWI/SNF related-matrix-associated actin-dependent regulator of chromatin subfamily C
VGVQEIQKVQNREGPINAVRVKQAAASAMAAAAVKAKLLADQEEREVQRLVSVVIEHQVCMECANFSQIEP